MIQPGENTDRLDRTPCERVEADLENPSALRRAAAGAPVVIHCAARVGGDNREALNRINVDGTRNLVEACLETGGGREKFIHVSSISAMGPSGRDILLGENAVCRPVSPYGESKLGSEQIVRSRMDRLPAAIVRLPLVYGPGCKAGITVLFKLTSLRFYPDIGEVAGTICFLRDAIRGLLAAAASQTTGGRTYVLGEPRPWFMRDFCRVIAGIMDVRPWVFPIPKRLAYGLRAGIDMACRMSGKPPILSRASLDEYFRHRYWCCDTSRASSDFGYETRFPLAQGARITIDWYRRRGHLPA
jgi:nucleoside-diphosphate-sugar epimerase